MKYSFLPKAMWMAFKGTYTKALSEVLNEGDPEAVMKRAHKKYRAEKKRGSTPRF